MTSLSHAGNVRKSRRVLQIFAVALVGTLLLAGGAKPAVAATATGNMAVSATVVATCSITPSALAFGNYIGAAVNQTATLTILCSNGTTYNVGLGPGTATGATVTNRSMFVTGATSVLLNYSLYSNTGRTANWGQTVGTDTVAGTGSGANQSLTVYGALPAGQYIAAGSYGDTILATITY